MKTTGVRTRRSLASALSRQLATMMPITTAIAATPPTACTALTASDDPTSCPLHQDRVPRAAVAVFGAVGSAKIAQTTCSDTVTK